VCETTQAIMRRRNHGYRILSPNTGYWGSNPSRIVDRLAVDNMTGRALLKNKKRAGRHAMSCHAEGSGKPAIDSRQATRTSASPAKSRLGQPV